MSFTLANVSSVAKRNIPIGTIMGTQGMGKSTLASLFPKSFFIWTEDGAKSIQVESGAKWLKP